ncbi:biotin/lipoyl-binding protein [Brachyspira aalborgi]|jgi:biotin carboxyl carrier protein|uniref:Biotin/lipoyl-binding protein n=1 Tax=Brachyspira aalborgi TaxID=29522 RepID=A0AB38PWF1_9SPIR|nr:biotin/lipoyl-containing protein [Brachyspira aalborgi]CCY74733.1 acetyl-CoA carboxylase biotin carboxyl carrier protein subunit [Brachyspira sp. CAG:700]TXJ15228.1 biotin/lipoyl-binding protein [Brachyspira aalborgi]TXJ18135.1 biotin/lipoyl-binding protein [Brachyspira aalborgi]TXJ24090.1 biotin/lipoyl-binding protein [Brachyspira aalborgi]TXJ31994.1 biotin/lipoyl-binding protein [Brachyspira aalborgi]
MIKQYKITVNGKLYDVLVEEVGEILGDVQASKTISTFINTDNANTNNNKEKQISNKSQDSIPIDENAISIKAPMPGTILSFNVSVGDTVSEGQVLAILEAMKMENELVSPASGKVKSIHVEKGSSVVENQIILQII